MVLKQLELRLFDKVEAMRPWKYLTPIVLFFCALSWWGYTEMEKSRAQEQEQRLREMLEPMLDVHANEPGGALARAWAICLERLQASDGDRSQRVTCDTMSGQGVTSSLVALKFDDEYVAVVESQIPDLAINDRLVVDVVGGPGDAPFYTNPGVSVEMVEKFRGDEVMSFAGGIMEELPQYQLMQRGFTIASIAYWGTSIRTLAAPDEIEPAMREVGLAIDHYRDELGGEPPLITASLGNHLVLGALGKERLQGMRILSLVPVMDGLQHHLENVMAREDWTSQDILSGEWVWRNIYAQTETGFAFDHRRMLDRREYIPRYVGEIDLPWRDIELETTCSAIVLGDSDPRTTAYLVANDNLPPYVEVWESDHDLYRDAPHRMRTLFAEFAECLVADQG